MAILAAIKWVLERTPPELAADVMRGGIHLTGGGSQLFGLDQYIATELGIPVLLAKEPTDCATLGLGYLVENLQLLQSIGKQGLCRWSKSGNTEVSNGERYAATLPGKGSAGA